MVECNLPKVEVASSSLVTRSRPYLLLDSRYSSPDFNGIVEDSISMNRQAYSPGAVLVIVDPAFGEKLRTVPAGQPVWIVMSPVNKPVIRSLWASDAAPDHLSGITGFRFDEGVSTEDVLLAELSEIDLHHGPYSSSSPYTQIMVMGARLTVDVRAGLSEFGFTDFTETEDGFSASRSDEDA